MNVRLLTVFLSLFGLLVSAHAAPLSLTEAVQLALQQNPDVAAADQDLRVMKAKLPQIRAMERLHASADASMIHLEQVPTLVVPPVTLPLPPQLGGPQQVALPTFPLAEENAATLTLTAHLPLSTGGRTRHAATQVREASTALTARAESTRGEVALAVARAYLNVVLAQHVAQVSGDAYAAVGRHVTQAEAMLNAGLIPKYDLIRAKTEQANADRRWLDARNQVDLAYAYLMALLGQPEGDRPELTTPLEVQAVVEAELPQLLQAAEAASSDMKALQARDRMYEAGAQAARAETRPIVALVAKEEVLRDKLPLTTPIGYVGVVVHVPLLDGGMADAKVAEQQALRERNANDMVRLRNGIQLEVRKYYLDFTSARKALDAAEQAVLLAQENLRLATRRFAVGEGNSIEEVDAVLALSLAETNRATARYQYDLAYYGLKKATGEILRLL